VIKEAGLKRLLYLSLVLCFFNLTRPLQGENAPLINIRALAPHIVVEMRYATPNNFTKITLYDVAECLLVEPVAERLARVQKRLEKDSLGLKVWDCYRPISVQEKLWNVVPDPRYVADPRKGSRHNRGTAVDLTLVDKNGLELPMPSQFDEFGPKAHRDFMDGPTHVLANRQKLQDAMEKEGFIGLPTEWWHFDAPEWNQYALRNEPLGDPHLKTDIKTKASLPLNQNVDQLIVVLSENWDSQTGYLQRYQRKNGIWQKEGLPWDVSLGLKGMSWGQGIHAVKADGPQKREGDNRAPAGVFKVGQGYGYDVSAPAGSAWPYTQVTEQWRCVDDPKSAFYNQIFPLDSRKSDWKSAELMKRQDHLYKWVINIEQNFPSVLKGCGSCIFLHIWRKPNAPTEGCTAMSEENMLDLLKWLKPDLNPHLVQLPKAIYTSVQEKWGFPE